MGIPVLRHDEKKPGGVAEVLAFFEGKGSEGEPVGLAITVDASVDCTRRFFQPYGVRDLTSLVG